MKQGTVAAVHGLDALSIGEALAVLSPQRGVRLAAARSVMLGAGGAEANVARWLARLGHTAAWAGRVGADALGDLVLDEISAAGVDVSAVVRDPDRPTGVYFKDPTPERTEVAYYRSGSAGSALAREDLRRLRPVPPRIVHVSGVTAALSESCAELVEEVVVGRRFASSRVSFDINHRPALWTARVAAEPLRRWAQHADVVFVGLDEAHRLWGCRTPAEVRDVVDRPAHLVVKDDADCAVSFDGAAATTVPALDVDVVERVGAGDAFAGGWLSCYLNGGAARARLSTGHCHAAEALGVIGDYPAASPHAQQSGAVPASLDQARPRTGR